MPGIARCKAARASSMTESPMAVTLLGVGGHVTGRAVPNGRVRCDSNGALSSLSDAGADDDADATILDTGGPAATSALDAPSGTAWAVGQMIMTASHPAASANPAGRSRRGRDSARAGRTGRAGPAGPATTGTPAAGAGPPAAGAPAGTTPGGAGISRSARTQSAPSAPAGTPAGARAGTRAGTCSGWSATATGP